MPIPLNRLIRSKFRKLRHVWSKTEHVHFLHIGKTGGTALRNVFSNYPPTGNRVLVAHGHTTTLADVPPGEKVVFVLRNPLTRYISGFNSRLREGQPRYFSPWSPEEGTAFKKFPRPTELAEALASTCPETKVAAEHAMRNILHVSEPYAKWFDSLDYLESRRADIKYVGFQESLHTDFEELKKALCLPANAELPSDKVAAHRSPDGVDKTLSPLAEEILRSWYAEDFKFIDYSKALMTERNNS